jgi:hypothetical protein
MFRSAREGRQREVAGQVNQGAVAPTMYWLSNSHVWGSALKRGRRGDLVAVDIPADVAQQRPCKQAYVFKFQVAHDFPPVPGIEELPAITPLPEFRPIPIVRILFFSRTRSLC